MASPDTFRILHGDLSRIVISWTLAIVSEGYTRAQLDKGDFDRDAKLVVDELLATAPFDDPGLNRLFVIAAVRVESERPGSEIKLLDPVPASSPFQTAFGAMYGRDSFEGKQIERALHGDSQLVKDKVQQFTDLATIENFLVIVNNDSTDGGLAHDGVGWFAKARSAWPKVAVHELGHQAFSLADEYAYRNSQSDPVRRLPTSPPPTEPVEPNITLDTNVATLKWVGLVTLPQTFVPGTVQAAACVRDHPLKPTDPEIPLNAVGAFEGAGYHDCGIFRPSRVCKMRDSAFPFCAVCQNAIRVKLGGYMLDQRKAEPPQKVGAWTHVLPFATRFAPGTLFYNSVLGNYALTDNFRFAILERRPDGSPLLVPGRPDIGVGNINAGWSTLAPFALGGVQHLFGHDFGSGRFAMWRLGGFGDTLIQTFFDTPGGTTSHVVIVTRDGAPHMIAYNMFTGDALMSRIDGNDAAPVDPVAMTWGAGITAVVPLELDGEPFVLTYRPFSGEVAIRKITASGFVMAFVRTAFWPTNITHVASTPKDGRPYVTRYAAGTGRMLIDHVRVNGTGLDFVCRVDPSPGPGAPSLFGIGAQVMGPFRSRNPGGLILFENLYLYRALSQELVEVFL